MIGARMLTDGPWFPEQPSLVLTRLRADAVGSRRAAADLEAAPAESDTMLLADCSFAYLGQPYVVAPDGRVFQPTADETGYSLIIHSFVPVEEVAP